MVSKPPRLASIDVLRAITMLLMIFVNDLWSIKGVPEWLEHTEADEDGMGLSDIVFPLFLFIIGLSVPHSVSARESRGLSSMSTFRHILFRSLALIVMGVLHVNLGNYSSEALIPKNLWQILITVAFFFVWLDYSPKLSTLRKNLLQGFGIILLIALALLYKGKSGDEIVWLKTKWWGILGLIGWTHFFSATIYLLVKNRPQLLWLALLIFLGISSASLAKWSSYDDLVKPFFQLPMDAGLPVLTIAGIIISVMYTRSFSGSKPSVFYINSIIIALLMCVFGFLTRPVWGISKIYATPSWITICTGISILVFLLMIWICDIRKKAHWFKIIRPAGTSTLTAYLLPYIHYALLAMVGVSLPLALRTGGIGILKCLCYALVIVLITGLLERYRLRLKL